MALIFGGGLRCGEVVSLTAILGQVIKLVVYDNTFANFGTKGKSDLLQAKGLKNPPEDCR
jgi:hypothetical protein